MVCENSGVLVREIKEWLLLWQSFIRNKDYHSAMRLFRDDVWSFGTVSTSAHDLEDLVKSQWKVVWERTADFTFDTETVKLFPSGDDDLVVVAIQWFGKGFGEQAGQYFDRRGRASIVLEKLGDTFLCVHTHFSINPDHERAVWCAD